MGSGLRYRLSAAGGTVLWSALVVLFVNQPVVLELLTAVPLLDNFSMDSAGGEELFLEVGIAALAVTVSCTPLFKPRPRRILDTITLTQERVLLAVFALATIGYFDYTYRVPRLTLIAVGLILLVVLPGWFVWIRRPIGDGTWLLVGDDPELMAEVYKAAENELIGYVAPPVSRQLAGGLRGDGGLLVGGPDYSGDIGAELQRLGGLASLEEVLVEYDVETALLAFADADRREFFGVLDTCYDHGVAAKVHRNHADSVLVTGDGVGPLVDVEIEPWDIQDHLMKRGFDVLFATMGLLVLSPVIVFIVLAIKFEGEGPVFFSQERTFLLGETFSVHKFRTLKPDPDGLVGTTIDEDRHTRLGRFLRTTHLDEVPQLWSILLGRMSVVGPRPAQTAIEDGFEAEAAEWRQRWFVKPGLTGLAQINGANSQNPPEKIQYDLQYIRNQSFWFDLKIIVRQLWMVAMDVWTSIRGAGEQDIGT